MSNLFDSFLQIAGARSFSDFLKGDKASSKRLRRSKKIQEDDLYEKH